MLCLSKISREKQRLYNIIYVWNLKSNSKNREQNDGFRGDGGWRGQDGYLSIQTGKV